MKLPLKNIRENYNKEEKQEEDNLFDVKYLLLDNGGNSDFIFKYNKKLRKFIA